MNHTHAASNDGQGVGSSQDNADPVEALAGLDPADAPGIAERYAAELAGELEQLGETPADPVQLQAELGDMEADPSQSDA